MEFLRAQPYANGKVGVIGFCSGGRHAYLAACSLSAIDAVVDCWGGNVIVDDPKLLTCQASGGAHRSYGQDAVSDPRPVRERRREPQTATRSTAPKQCSRDSARTTNSTATTAPATPSSMRRGPPTGRSRRSMAGTRCLHSTESISPRRQRRVQRRGVSSVEQDHSGSQVNPARVSGEFVVARGDGAKVLEFIEEALDEVAFAVERSRARVGAKIPAALAAEEIEHGRALIERPHP